MSRRAIAQKEKPPKKEPPSEDKPPIKEPPPAEKPPVIEEPPPQEETQGNNREERRDRILQSQSSGGVQPTGCVAVLAKGTAS